MPPRIVRFRRHDRVVLDDAEHTRERRVRDGSPVLRSRRDVPRDEAREERPARLQIGREPARRIDARPDEAIEAEAADDDGRGGHGPIVTDVPRRRVQTCENEPRPVEPGASVVARPRTRLAFPRRVFRPIAGASRHGRASRAVPKRDAVSRRVVPRDPLRRATSEEAPILRRRPCGIDSLPAIDARPPLGDGGRLGARRSFAAHEDRVPEDRPTGQHFRTCREVASTPAVG